MNPFVAENLKSFYRGKKIALGITGSIAAFKAHDLVRYFKECGAEVRVILTQSARQFVTPLTLETLSGNPVLDSLWDSRAQGNHHIDAARWADVFLVAPATANLIAELRAGLTPDLLTTELLATRTPVVIAPAMNPEMWNHPATQENVSVLKTRGVRFLGPVEGITSCGETGIGRMLEPEQIVEEMAFQLAPKLNNPLQFLVTLGPTQSPLDPVRVLTNRSSGKMGAALCYAALLAGHRVRAVVGPSSVALPRSSAFEFQRVETAIEMARAVEKALQHTDVFISCAAVLDWDVTNPAVQKLKKSKQAPEIRLHQNPDILKQASQNKSRRYLTIGFAAETTELLKNASNKFEAKNCDALFANQVNDKGLGFEASTNSGIWFEKGGKPLAIPHSSKTDIAKHIIERAIALAQKHVSEESPKIWKSSKPSKNTKAGAKRSPEKALF